MTNPFRDQEKFMTACDQCVTGDDAQYEMYRNLITGAIHSAGFDGEGAWKEVMKTNFAKIDKKTGKVRKREDGKVLKPVGWTAPELEQFLTRP